MNALGLDPNAVLVSNGVEGDLRLNLGTWYVQPFVFGGASWVRYDITNENFNTSDVANSDDTFAIPVGGGIAYNYRNFMLDARFTKVGIAVSIDPKTDDLWVAQLYGG